MTELIGMLLFLTPLALVVGWIVWLSRRPNRPCPSCTRLIAVSTTQCPVCGAAVPAQEPKQDPARTTSRKKATVRRASKQSRPV